MSGLLRKLAAYLCKPIYILIRDIYYIFYNLANTRFLKSEIVSQFSSNIYVLVSVVMLFAFSVVILSAIVNPDLLNDNKKGVTALFKRSIIALFLMVLVPFMFNVLYKVQENIMDNSLIEKIIVGTNVSCQPSDSDTSDSDTTSDEPEDYSQSKCRAGGNGGQVIAGTLLQSVLYPVGDDIDIDEEVGDLYANTILKNIDWLGKLASHINATTDGGDEGWFADSDTNYAFKFNGLLAIVCGLGCVYILIIYSIDIAVRVFKLAFMELTAPISIVGYIASGNKILSSWFQELVKTYTDLFIRIAAIAFYLFLISNLSSFLEPFENQSWGFVLKAFLVVGMLIFVKQIPDMISKIFGVDIKTKGGISGRLGEMAGVGKQVQKAWNAVRNPLAAAAGIGSMALGTGAHIASAIRTSGKNGAAAVKRIRADGKKFSGLRSTGAVVGAIVGGTWGATVGSANSAVRSLKNGVNNKNLHSMKDEYDLYKDTHKEGSTLFGRTIDDVREGTGFKSRADSKGAANEHLTNSASALRNMRSKAREVLNLENSAREVYDGMNLRQANEFLDSIRNSAPVMSDFKNDDGSIDMNSFNAALDAHQQHLIDVSNAIETGTRNAELNVINDALTGNLNGSAEEIAASYDLNNEYNTLKGEYKKTGDDTVSSLNLNTEIFSEQMENYERIINQAIINNNATKDAAGNLTKYGRQKADNDSRGARPGNKKSESSESKK